MRGAIIGLGNVAVHGHLPGWRRRADVEIVAATDSRPERRTVLASELPRARWYDAPAALLAAESLDFVDICTPPSSHAPLIRDALAGGLHVLCEKPLVHAADDLAALTALAVERARVLHTVHNWHHAPMVARTREAVERGDIGRVTAASWETLRVQPAAVAAGAGPNWRLDPAIAGGGVLSDHGWHVFYILQRWLGGAPTAVAATLETRRHTAFAVEDTATVRLTFPHATADVLLTWAADERRNRAEIRGTTGRLVLDGDVITLERDGEAAPTRWTCPPSLADGSQHPDWFDAVAAEFVAETRRAAPTRANLAEAAVCVAIESAARASSRRGGAAVPLTPARATEVPR